ncbi:MAG: hypothetical protein WCT03_22475, partial [Candidatus Obscuribacterales bacterium]
MTTVLKSARQATFSLTLSLSIAFALAPYAIAQSTAKPAAKPVTSKAAPTPGSLSTTPQTKAPLIQTGIVTHSEASSKPTGLTGKIESLGDQSKGTQAIVSKF